MYSHDQFIKRPVHSHKRTSFPVGYIQHIYQTLIRVKMEVILSSPAGALSVVEVDTHTVSTYSLLNKECRNLTLTTFFKLKTERLNENIKRPLKQNSLLTSVRFSSKTSIETQTAERTLNQNFSVFIADQLGSVSNSAIHIVS